METTDGFKRTQLRDLYDAIAKLKEQEQTALAEMHAEDPELLLHRFKHSVERVGRYPPNTEPFHGDRPQTADEPVPAGDIKTTHDFSTQLNKKQLCEVEGAPEFNFRFVDREIFPLRSTLADGPRADIRWLDLLLASTDGLPIIGELKIGSDKATYFALVQALMYATELSSDLQRTRLAQHYPELRPGLDVDGPFLDLYLVLFKPPSTGRYRERLFEATEKISATLVEDSRLNMVIRRIACIEASPQDYDTLTFRRLFSYGPGPSANDQGPVQEGNRAGRRFRSF